MNIEMQEVAQFPKETPTQYSSFADPFFTAMQNPNECPDQVMVETTPFETTTFPAHINTIT